MFQIFVFNSCACQAIAYQTIPQKCLMFASEINMRQMLTTEKAHLFNTTYCYCVTVQWIHTCLKSCFDSLCQQRILMCLQIKFTVWCKCVCRSGLLCDVTLKVGGVELSAHRNILSSGSQYFYAMFTGDLAESKSDCITLQEIDPKALSLLIDFIYTSEIQVTEENVQVSHA